MLNLVQTQHGVFDLSFDAKDVDQAAAATVVYATLFTDAKAPANRVADSFEQRGWWANPNAGTGLWYVRRQALSAAARAEAIAMLRTSLLEKAPALTNIEVTDASPNAATAGSVSAVVVEIKGQHNGLNFLISTTL